MVAVRYLQVLSLKHPPRTGQLQILFNEIDEGEVVVEEETEKYGATLQPTSTMKCDTEILTNNRNRRSLTTLDG